MFVLVSDANIFIDFDVADLTTSLFKLPHEFVTSNIVYHQELIEQHADLPGFGLRIQSLSGDDVRALDELVARYPRPGVNDLSVLVLALRNEWMLVSGDKNLRDAAKREDVQVHGTIWLVEQLINESVLSVDQARSAFDSMQKAGRRLPWVDVQKFLDAYD